MPLENGSSPHCDSIRLLVRPWQAGDAPRVFQAVRQSLAELLPWAPWCHPGYALEETEAFAASRAAAWASAEDLSLVVVAPDGSVVGGTGLNAIDRVHSRANLGYWVRSDQAGRGVATALAARVARWGLEELGFARIEIVAARANHASCRVAEKAGAVLEGYQRARVRIRGQIHDAASYAAVAGDLSRLPPTPAWLDWQVPVIPHAVRGWLDPPAASR